MGIYGDSYNDRKIREDEKYHDKRFLEELEDPSVAALVERLDSKGPVSAEDIAAGRARGGRIAEMARAAAARSAEKPASAVSQSRTR